MSDYKQTTISGYKVSIFPTYDGTELYVTDPNGVKLFGHKVSGDPTERAMEIIAQDGGVATYDKKLMKQAVQQTLAHFINFTDGKRSTAYSAVMKADSMLNKTSFDFDGTKLTFISPDSGQQRIVTKSGCSDLCPCKNQMSYHTALFEIFIKYTRLVSDRNVKAFPAKPVREYRRAA